MTAGAAVGRSLPGNGRWVCVDEVAPQPWRNGGGRTRELLAGPSSADWAWRLSVADIDRDGPFSAFPDVERWFVVLEGAGVELDWPHRRQVLRPGDAPCRFDGADAPGCRLLDGPTRDLNLMLRGVAGAVTPCDAGQAWRPDAAHAGLFSWHGGSLRVDEGPAWELPAGSLCWWDHAPALLQFAPGLPSAAWWIAVTPSFP